MDLLIITAFGCGGCNSLKSSGGLRKIMEAVKENGGTPYHFEFPSVTNSVYDSKGQYKKMDTYINGLYKGWFPMFIAVPAGTVSLIENGSLNGDADVAGVSTVFNGIFNGNKFQMGNERQFSDGLVINWYLNVSQKNKSHPSQPFQQNSIQAPKFPQLGSAAVYPSPAELGTPTGKLISSCPKDFGFYLNPVGNR